MSAQTPEISDQEAKKVNVGSAKAPPRFAFMDATEAAANLRTDRLTVLKYIQEGKLRTFGGRTGNPFVRTEEVERLVKELFPEVGEEETVPTDPKVVHRNDPVRKIKLRMQQDAKWHEVDEAAMQAWATELDPISFNRMSQVARDAIKQLQLVIKVLEEAEATSKLTLR
ncbi:MAG: hypothetical protein WCS37_17235 [Chloroflexota bacterium]